MWRMVRVLIVMVLLLVNVPATFAQPAPFAKGVNLVFHGYDSTDPAAISRLFDRLQLLQINSLLITFPVYMDSWSASQVNALFDVNEIHPFADSPTIEELAIPIAMAQERGWEVWIRPLLDEGKITETGPDGAWRGTIQPADSNAYFASFEAMLQYYLQVQGASWLVLGTELASLEVPAYSPYWEGMIDRLRLADPSGSHRLTYAQNWNTGESQGYPSWFSRLDAVSIDAYYPAAGLSNLATADQIETALLQWQSDLEQLRNQSPNGKLYISEVGLTSQLAEPTVLERPWTFQLDGSQVGLELQANYVTGSCRAYRQVADANGVPLVDGIFWWHTAIGSVSETADPLQDRSFEFIGKPAEQTVAECFKA